MNDKFDELAKGLAQSVTRRGALKKFGLGLAGVTLAALGLANKSHAGQAKSCNRWRCSVAYAGQIFDTYVCDNKRPHYDKLVTCARVGPVDCSYCNASGQPCC